MSHAQISVRKFIPLHSKRAENIRESCFEQYRAQILGLKANKTSKQIVDFFAQDQEAKNAGFQPSYSQIVKWVGIWNNRIENAPPARAASALLPDTGPSSHDPGLAADLTRNGLQGIDEADIHMDVDERHAFQVSLVAKMSTAAPARLPECQALPVGSQRSFNVASNAEAGAQSTLDVLWPAPFATLPDFVDESQLEDAWRHKALDRHAKDTVMGELEAEPPMHREPTPVIFTRSPQSSICSFKETSNRAGEAFPPKPSTLRATAVSLSIRSKSIGSRSDRSGKTDGDSDKIAPVPSQSISAILSEVDNPSCRKQLKQRFENHDIRLPLQELGLSVVAAGFVRSRKTGSDSCMRFASQHPELFREDPLIFYAAAALALKYQERTLARHCLDCFNLLRAYHELAKGAFNLFMLDLVAIDCPDHNVSKEQRKINQTFVESSEEGLNRLRARSDNTPSTQVRQSADISLASMPAPVTYEHFAQRWRMAAGDRAR